MMVVMRGKDTLIFLGLVWLLGLLAILVIFSSFRSLYCRTPRRSDLVSSKRERCITRVLRTWTEFWFHIVQTPYDISHHTSEAFTTECQGLCSSYQESKKTSKGRCHQFFTFSLVNPNIIPTLVAQGQWKLCAVHVWIKFFVDFSWFIG